MFFKPRYRIVKVLRETDNEYLYWIEKFNKLTRQWSVQSYGGYPKEHSFFMNYYDALTVLSYKYLRDTKKIVARKDGWIILGGLIDQNWYYFIDRIQIFPGNNPTYIEDGSKDHRIPYNFGSSTKAKEKFKEIVDIEFKSVIYEI